MFSEIGKNDTRELQNTEGQNFQDIKPESGMTVSEANKYWDSVFDDGISTGAEISEVSKQYLDDNGNEYREEDELKPNAEFERNGYRYKTDERGRVVSAEGKLKMRDPDYKRDMEKVRTMDSKEYKDTDDMGHVIGHQFGGSDKLENLVPMDAKLNRGDFAKLENTLADAVKNGADVRMKVEPVYEGDSMRPTEFRVSYSVDGEKDAVIFKNGSEN